MVTLKSVRISAGLGPCRIAVAQSHLHQHRRVPEDTFCMPTSTSIQFQSPFGSPDYSNTPGYTFPKKVQQHRDSASVPVSEPPPNPFFPPVYRHLHSPTDRGIESIRSHSWRQGPARCAGQILQTRRNGCFRYPLNLEPCGKIKPHHEETPIPVMRPFVQSPNLLYGFSVASTRTK